MCDFIEDAVKAVGDLFDQPGKPKPDKNVLAAQRAEFERQAQATTDEKNRMLKMRRQQASSAGVRSLITGSRAGYGRGLTV